MFSLRSIGGQHVSHHHGRSRSAHINRAVHWNDRRVGAGTLRVVNGAGTYGRGALAIGSWPLIYETIGENFEIALRLRPPPWTAGQGARKIGPPDSGRFRVNILARFGRKRPIPSYPFGNSLPDDRRTDNENLA
jgi:hypothetical protein